MLWIIVLVLILLAIFGAPGLAVQHSYGYYPSGLLTIVVIVLVVLLLSGRF